LISVWSNDERPAARAGSRHEQTAVLEHSKRLVHDRAAHAERLGELAGGRQPVTGSVAVRDDRVPELLRDLLEAAVGLDRSERDRGARSVVLHVCASALIDG
jgi:hypothetical protein